MTKKQGKYFYLFKFLGHRASRTLLAKIAVCKSPNTIYFQPCSYFKQEKFLSKLKK